MFPSPVNKRVQQLNCKSGRVHVITETCLWQFPHTPVLCPVYSSCRAVVEVPTVLFVYVNSAWKKRNHLASKNLLKRCNEQGRQSVDRKSPAPASGPSILNCGTGYSASSHPEVFPGTPWWLRCCRRPQRQQGTGRPSAVHETLLQETQNPSRRLTSCHPCLESLVFSPQSVDKHNSTFLSYKRTK